MRARYALLPGRHTGQRCSMERRSTCCAPCARVEALCRFAWVLASSPDRSQSAFGGEVSWTHATGHALLRVRPTSGLGPIRVMESLDRRSRSLRVVEGHRFTRIAWHRHECPELARPPARSPRSRPRGGSRGRSQTPVVPAAGAASRSEVRSALSDPASAA